MADPAILSGTDLQRLIEDSNLPPAVIAYMAQQRAMPDSGWSQTGYAKQWAYPYAGEDSEALSQRYGVQGDSTLMGQMNALRQLQGLNYPRSEGGAPSYAAPAQPKTNALAQLMQMLMGIGR